MKKILSLILLGYLFLPSAMNGQDQFAVTSGWKEYFDRDSKIGFKYPRKWKPSAWSKDHIYISMTGDIFDHYTDEHGRPVHAFLQITIQHRPLNDHPLFAEFRRTDISSYDDYEYVEKGKRSSILWIFLDIDGKSYVQCRLDRYLPEQPGSVQTLKLTRTLIHSITLR